MRQPARVATDALVESAVNVNACANGRLTVGGESVEVGERAGVVVFGDGGHPPQHAMERRLLPLVGGVRLQDAFIAKQIKRQIEPPAPLVFADVTQKVRQLQRDAEM